MAEVGVEEPSLAKRAAPGNRHIDRLGIVVLPLERRLVFLAGHVETDQYAKVLTALEALRAIPIDLVLVPKALALEGRVKRVIRTLDLEGPRAAAAP